MKKNSLFMCLCLLAGSFIGCSDDDNGPTWKEIYDEQQVAIKAFVANKSPLHEFKYPVTYLGETFDDCAYLFEYDGNGTTPKAGQFILVNYTRKSLNGDVLDSTYPSVSGGAKVTPYFELGGPVYFQVNDNDKIIDPSSDAWKMMAEGTTGSIILSSLMTQSTTYLYREYKLEKIIQKESLLAYENELIDNYIENELAGEKVEEILHVNDTVAKIVYLQEGTGEKIQKTDSVTLWFEGEILDEFNSPLRKFVKMEEKEDALVTMKVGDLPTKGLQDAIVKLTVGTEAKLFLPSGWGFGYEGGYNILTGQCTVPSYSTLMFHLKIKSRKTVSSGK